MLADIVVRGPHSLADFALGLDAGDEREQEFPPGDGACQRLGYRQERGCHGARWVDNCVGVGVVVVVDVGGYSVEQTCVLGVYGD